MIFFTAVAAGLALIWPIIGALLNNELIQMWHWIALGSGIAVLAGCVVFIVHENKG